MTSSVPCVGIDDISLATTTFRLDAEDLADANGLDVGKIRIGIGQDSQSVPAADEDIVTLAASAAAPIIDRHGAAGISTVILATESGVDQSKSAGLYVHSLLGLSPNARVVELKQACYGGTAGIQFAAGVLQREGGKVLVIASDIARYDLGSSGESTQGAAAVAILMVAESPAIATLDPISGVYSADIMDFWRPNHRATARVDGHRSISAYLDAITNAYKEYTEKGGVPLDAFAAFCYHQPFTKMAIKAHRHLLETAGIDAAPERIERDTAASMIYNRTIGNSYTASLYVGLCSLLDHVDGLDGSQVALASYGSGCVAEFFSLTVQPGYRKHLRTESNRAAVAIRRRIGYPGYLALRDGEPAGCADHEFERQSSGPFRLAGISDEKRIYAPNSDHVVAGGLRG